MPTNGAKGSLTYPLRPIVPVRIFLANEAPRPGSAFQTVPPSPYSLSLARISTQRIVPLARGTGSGGGGFATRGRGCRRRGPPGAGRVRRCGGWGGQRRSGECGRRWLVRGGGGREC